MNIHIGVIFDFDGTLLDSIRTAYKGMCAVFQAEGAASPSFQEFNSRFHPPYLDFYRSRGVKACEQAIWDIYSPIARHEHASLFWDVASTLLKLQSDFGARLAIVSNQRQATIERICEDAGISSRFESIQGEIADKAACIRTTVRSMRLHPDSTYYVGDFASDVKAAIDAGVIAVGITRGQPVRAELERAGANPCIDHLSELVHLIRDRYTDTVAMI